MTFTSEFSTTALRSRVRGVSGEPLVKDVFDGDVSGQAPRTLDLNAVVENSDVNVIRYAVIPVNDGVGNNLVKSLGRILNRLKSFRAHLRNFFRLLSRQRHGVFDLVV